MKILKIENRGLTGYYLEQKLSDVLEKTGLNFVEDKNGDLVPDEIEIHYLDEKDLETKLSLILWRLADR